MTLGNMCEADTVGTLLHRGAAADLVAKLKPQIQYFVGHPAQRVMGGNYDASRDRLATELRRSFGLWRASQHAQFQLAQLQHAELQWWRRHGHAGACDIGSRRGRGELRQG